MVYTLQSLTILEGITNIKIAQFKITNSLHSVVFNVYGECDIGNKFTKHSHVHLIHFYYERKHWYKTKTEDNSVCKSCKFSKIRFQFHLKAVKLTSITCVYIDVRSHLSVKLRYTHTYIINTHRVSYLSRHVALYLPNISKSPATPLFYWVVRFTNNENNRTKQNKKSKTDLQHHYGVRVHIGHSIMIFLCLVRYINQLVPPENPQNSAK